jgi:hypothetical protein
VASVLAVARAAAVKNKSTRSGKPATDTPRTTRTAPSSRTLLFHAGLHKTGSTALQTYLTRNASRLTEAGVAYNFAAGNAGGPGNGQYLFELVRKGGITDDHIDELLAVHLGNCTTGIVSSEDFSHFGVAEWQRLASASGRLNARIRTATFVRDLAAYYSSLHAQLVGAGETTESFQEFAARPDIFAPVIASLRSQLEVFQRDAMTVIHYESVVGAIDKTFLGTLGLDCEAYDDAPLRARVNRSLTDFEQHIVLRVTRAIGIQLARRLSGHLKARRPQLKASRHYGTELIAQMSARHTADVQWINDTFFGGESVLHIVRDIANDQAGSELGQAECRAIDDDVIDWCLDKLKISQDETIRYMGRRLYDIDWNLATNPLVPADFDPIAYLAQNPDVMRRGLAPFRHYIDHGHKEPNRKWKWTN